MEYDACGLPMLKLPVRAGAPKASAARLGKQRNMPNCDFYALPPDSEAILDFVFSNPGWRLLEAYSEPDQELRTFTSIGDVTLAFDLTCQHTHLMLYAPEMRGHVAAKRIDLKPGALGSATFRYSLDGWGLIQLLFEAPRKNELAASHTNHNSQKRAERWAPTYPENARYVAEWDWAAVTRVSSRLVRHIRRLGASKVGSRPVLPAALEAQRIGNMVLGL